MTFMLRNALLHFSHHQFLLFPKFKLVRCKNIIPRTFSSGAGISTAIDIKVPPLLETAFNSKSAKSIALTEQNGQSHTYEELCSSAMHVAGEIRELVGPDETRIAFVCPRDSSFPVTLWASWISGNVAVPLAKEHPENMLKYYIEHSDAKVVITTTEFADKMKRITDMIGGGSTKLHVVDFDSISHRHKLSVQTTEVDSGITNRSSLGNALILFTSGTTGSPKGVLLSHQNLEAQVQNMCHAWELRNTDTLLHVLPLHHTHGLCHIMITAFAVGAKLRMIDKFDAGQVWSELLSTHTQRTNLLMGVPTVYAKLIEYYDKSYAGDLNQMEFVRKTCQDKMRVMMCGSASLPVPVLEKWESITGHRLLEKFGMTEIGMALANPLHGVRKPGFAGLPVQSSNLIFRLVNLNPNDNNTYKVLVESNENGTQLFSDNIDDPENIVGDIIVKGPSVFKEYWRNPEGTSKEFTHDGWFITGDTAQFRDGAYKILGRNSVDIIKSGGYKLSALEIETKLLSLDEIQEVSVCGLDDPIWGQKVGAIIVWKGQELTIQEFRALAKTLLPAYACPSVIKTVQELPKNHVGKVNKKELVKLFSL